MHENLQGLGLNYRVYQIGAMLCLFFTGAEVVDYASVATADTGRFKKYFWASLERGVYLAPSQYECMFPSAVHSDEDIERTLKGNYEALKAAH
jgi:glutamate-1-semialdehyde 2,1-aminomutase